MASGISKKAGGIDLQTALQEGVKLQRAGNIAKALQLYKKILKIVPDQPDTLHLIGLCFHQQKNDRKAVELIGKSLAILPDNPVAQNNMGVSLCALGKFDKAEEHYRASMKLHPGYAEAHTNLAALQSNRQEIDAAIKNYQIAIKSTPNHFPARKGLGNALVSIGRPTDALTHYQVALKLNPRDADLQTDTAIALKLLGRTEEAIPFHHRAMQLVKGENRHLFAFANTISGNKLTAQSDGLEQILINILNCRQINPIGILAPALSLLMLSEDFNAAIVRLAKMTPDNMTINQSDLKLLVEHELFLKILEMMPLADSEVELALTHARQALLLEQVSNSKTNLQFIVALAGQCFNNEYAYFVTTEEQAALKQLEHQIASTLKRGETPEPHHVALLACYKPLFQSDFGEELRKQKWPDVIASVIVRQLDEPAEERELRGTIECLTEIANDVSQEVRTQYEDNPYPRWIHTGLTREGRKVGDLLRANPLLMDLGDYETPDNPDVLVAGCGTGQHSLQSATRFLKTNVLAIDLSLTSLAYAKRQTKQLGVRNIQFGQADILELGKLDRQFDVVESAGVLHHLEHPMAGWRVLVDLLRPGGLMKIALYSELARQDIVAAREYIAKKGYSSSPEDIRACRRDIITGGPDVPTQLKNRTDFYSLSACRDLIFHTQEHRFNLLQIEECLNALGLEFIDFELQAPQYFTAKRKDINKSKGNERLKRWHQFETEFPNTFANMYQFWCRKPKGTP